MNLIKVKTNWKDYSQGDNSKTGKVQFAMKRWTRIETSNHILKLSKITRKKQKVTLLSYSLYHIPLQMIMSLKF